MPALAEAQQSGKRESLADLIANIEAEACPYTSMVDKRKRPNQKLHTWQVKAYPKVGHRGVLDNKDATEFQSNNRLPIQAMAQKTWYNPAVSDFAEETEVAGLAKGEMAEQTADALVTVKRQIEMRCLSNSDCLVDDGTTHGNETRGGFSWVATDAQALYPVPDGFRTPAASIYTGTMANFGEEPFLAMGRASFKQRRGPVTTDWFLGIDLKAEFTKFTKYVDNLANKVPVRQFNATQEERVLINVIDGLVMDTGRANLHPSTFLWTDPTTGEPTAYTHRSGLGMDMNMVGLAYIRLPRVIPLQYAGGGKKAIVDAIFLHMVDNPLGQMAIKIQE